MNQVLRMNHLVCNTAGEALLIHSGLVVWLKNSERSSEIRPLLLRLTIICVLLSLTFYARLQMEQNKDEMTCVGMSS